MAYDVRRAFERIENELIDSMIRNLDHHRKQEELEGFNWSQWQVEQMSALAEYRWRNAKKFGTVFKDINAKVQSLIHAQRIAGNADQEVEILEAIKKGFRPPSRAKGIGTSFFHANNRRMDALVNATTNDLEKAEHAILRRANDQYRKVIFDAQVYANSGAATYKQAIDMATKDMLSTGINCVQYKNGSRHTASDYADMAVKTASKRAYLTGEGEKRNEWGMSLVIINKRGGPCPKCLPWVGKILIDDVYSGGSAKDGNYPLLSKAMAAGLYHPRCKDSHSTYYDGITTEGESYEKEELEDIKKNYEQEQRQQYAQRQADKYDRLAQYSLDEGNKEQYQRKADEWKGVANADKSDIIKAGSKNRRINKSKIIERGIEEKRPVFDDGKLRNAYLTRNVQKKENFYDVVMHGASQTVNFFGEKIDHNTLSYIIKNRKDYNGEAVRLLSCNTGLADIKGECIAQRLADELNVVVEAPDGYLNILPNGDLTVGDDPFNPNGEMKLFYPKKR